MLDNAGILVIGLAAVIDTVLLLAMFEKPNRRHVAWWMFLLAGGAWLWHAGSFLHVLLDPAAEAGQTGWRVPVRLVVTAGLLLMPSALLHGVLRLWRYGLAAGPRDPRLALVYLPMTALVPIGFALTRQPDAAYLTAVAAWTGPYLTWMATVNVIAAVAFAALSRQSEPVSTGTGLREAPRAARQPSAVLAESKPIVRLPRARTFFRWMAATLMAVTAVVLVEVLFARLAWPAAAEWLDLIATVSPVAPGLVFAYFIVRHRFAPLIVERSLIYGGVLLGVLLLHYVAVGSVRDELSARYRIDLAIVQGVLVVVLVLSYSPLRRRMLLAVRTLLGSSPEVTRRKLGALSVELSARAGQPPRELFEWFLAALPEALRVEYAAGWLFDAGGRVHLRAGDTTRLDDTAARDLEQTLRAAATKTCVWADPPDERSAEALDRADASLALLLERADLRGLLLLGRQALNQPPTDEELAGIVLVAEQLAAALDNARLLAERRTAEERAAQAEKLSMLGLLAGSIAHEVKNPLSSIKTLASVLAEELGPDSPHAGDLALIQSEIDRLARTTSQLLEFARPARSAASAASVGQALERTLAVLRHLARQSEVRLETDVAADIAPVAMGEPELREVLFNLLSNSIDAAGRGGCVSIRCRQENGCVVAEVHDSGPGLPPGVREHLFEPFVTTKENGTGLGLYTVARRLREAGGRITCDSTHDTGTLFRLELPRAEGTDNGTQ